MTILGVVGFAVTPSSNRIHLSTAGLRRRSISPICCVGKISGDYGMELVFGLIIAAVVAVLIAKDADSRGMNGLGWGIFTFLVCIIAVPIYVVVRKPRQA